MVSPTAADLGAKWRMFAASRDGAIREELIARYLPLARNISVRVYALRSDSSVRFEDYLQYARVGLVESVDRFDPERGASFETFSSYRIRGAILNGLSKQSEVAAQRSFWAKRERERLDSLKLEYQQHSSRDPLEKIADLTVGLAMGYMLDNGFDEPVDEGTDGNPYASAALQQLTEVIKENVSSLPPRERQLLHLHYFEHREFQSIAAEWGISKGRVSQLHSQALKRLRNRLESTLVDQKL